MQAASNDPPPSIDIHYAFLHSSVTTKESKGYEDSHIHIISDGTRPFADGRVPCTAEFEWREFMADFNCHYHPSTATFADFAVVEDSMEGGMEEVVKKITIEMHQEKDDNRNLFLVVRMDFGYSACSSIQGILFGKKVLEGKEVGKCVAKWDCLYDPKGKTFGAWKTIPTSVKGWGPRLTKIVPSFMRNKTVEGAQSDKGKGKEGGYLATKEMVVYVPLSFAFCSIGGSFLAGRVVSVALVC